MSGPSPRYIVHGATGAQGAPVVTALTAAGFNAIGAVRDVTRIGGPAMVVDLSSTEALIRAYRGSGGVFIHLPEGRPEDHRAQMTAVSRAIRVARPKRVVMSTSGHAIGPGSGSAIAILHHELQAIGVPFAVVEPQISLENLLAPQIFDAALREGVLRLPMHRDVRLRWSSHLDVADTVTQLFHQHVGGRVLVGASPGLSGPDIAAGFSRYFEREIAYEAISQDAFLELSAFADGGAVSGQSVVDRLHRAQVQSRATDGSVSAVSLLGLRPRAVHEWLGDLGI
ncbi:SDR family oxidoreductase [Plantibacter sp. CFBP 8804]|uniref:SDR family oxidoreductase n=1 Tax=Plantibacter sp. CFBP 8804 TaxID=2775270 RepID=UPI001FCECC65|nr:NmrA family NAD(P)-binding protein [Plantibacter sp. CFBP 8804]